MTHPLAPTLTRHNVNEPDNSLPPRGLSTLCIQKLMNYRVHLDYRHLNHLYCRRDITKRWQPRDSEQQGCSSHPSYPLAAQWHPQANPYVQSSTSLDRLLPPPLDSTSNEPYPPRLHNGRSQPKHPLQIQKHQNQSRGPRWKTSITRTLDLIRH